MRPTYRDLTRDSVEPAVARQADIEAWRASAERFTKVESEEDRSDWIDRAVRLCDPEITWDLRDFAGPPGIPVVLYGVDAVRPFWEDWLATWTPLELEFEMVDAGESVVMLVEVDRFRARGSTQTITLGPYAQVATFNDGLMTSWKVYADQARALEAAFAA